MNEQKRSADERSALTAEEDALIDRTAEEILDRFCPAFEELAK